MMESSRGKTQTDFFVFAICSVFEVTVIKIKIRNHKVCLMIQIGIWLEQIKIEIARILTNVLKGKMSKGVYNV